VKCGFHAKNAVFEVSGLILLKKPVDHNIQYLRELPQTLHIVVAYLWEAIRPREVAAMSKSRLKNTAAQRPDSRGDNSPAVFDSLRL